MAALTGVVSHRIGKGGYLTQGLQHGRAEGLPAVGATREATLPHEPAGLAGGTHGRPHGP